VTGQKIFKGSAIAKPSAAGGEGSDYKQALMRYAASKHPDNPAPTSEDDLIFRKLYGQADDQPWHGFAPQISIVQTPQGFQAVDRIKAAQGQAGAASPIVGEGGDPLQPKPPAMIQDKINAYQDSIRLADQTLALANKIGWRGVGPVSGPMGKLGAKFGISAIPGSDPEAETLRNNLEALKAYASFQTGGKQFTGTERALLMAFLSDINMNPKNAMTRLQNFRSRAQQTLDIMNKTGQVPPEEGGAPSAGPGAAPGGVSKYKVTVVQP